MSDPVKGLLTVLQFMKAGEYRDFLCATDSSIDFETETKPVKTVGDGIYKRYVGQSIGYTVTLNGLIKLNTGDDPAAFDLLDYQLAMTGIEFRMIFEDEDGNIKVVFGEALIDKTTLAAPSDGFSNANFSFKGNGEPTILDSLVACDSAITVANVDATGLPFLLVINIVTVTGSTPMRYEYSLDGGGRLISYITTIDFSGLASGSHSVEIWPICDNGFDGTSITKTFTV